MSLTVADRERAFLIAQLGLTEAQGAMSSLADLRQAFYTNPPVGGGADAMSNYSRLFWPHSTSTPTGQALSSTWIYFTPFYLAKKINFTSLTIRVATAVVATEVRLGFYTLSNGVFTLVAEVGPFDSTTTGEKTITGLNITLPAGDYWVGSTCKGGSPSVFCVSGVGVVDGPFAHGGPQLNGMGVYGPVSSGVLGTPMDASVAIGVADLNSVCPVLRFDGVTYP